MTTILITGARGFVGRHLAVRLASFGYKVSGIGHGNWPSSEAERWGVSTWINGEVSSSNLERLAQLIGIPEIVFHLAGGSSVGAAIASPHEDFRRTVVATAELLEWIRQHASNTRLVAISSAAVYGAGHEGCISENAKLRPFSPYGAHKLMMEDLCRSYSTNFGLQVVIPRLFSVYGAELKKQLLWDLCGKFLSGGPVELGGTGQELRDWTDVRDVASALAEVASLASSNAPVLNVATGISTPVRDIAKMVGKSWCGSEADAKVRFSGQSRQGDPFSLVANVDLMHSQGIVGAISVEKGITDYVAWYRSDSARSI